MNLFEGCFEKALSSDLKWINEPQEWGFQDGRLVIEAPAGGDFFLDPGGSAPKNSAPFLYTNVSGDFRLTTQVSVDMKEQYDSGCLMIMAKEDYWAKVCFEFFEEEPSILSVVTRGTSDDCVSAPTGVSVPYLSIARAGNSFAFHYSKDGQRWKLVRYFGLDCPRDIQIGIVAQSPIGQGCQVIFESLELQHGVDGDIREVVS